MAVALANSNQNTLPRANTRPAADPFPADDFVTIQNVAVFAEHQTKARDGRVLKFGREQLEAVANRCNQRISETGDYAAVSIGHTSDAGDAVQTKPEVIGAAGPFRLGILGEPGQRQRYCILADFHIQRRKLGAYNANPRRSPELWLEDSYDEMFLDPISLLGAEAPRLDMGLAPLVNASGDDGAFTHLYSAVRHGRLREKYAAAFPCDFNASMPGDEPNGKTKTKQYAADTPKTQDEREMTMLQPEDIRQIADAFEGLEFVVQWKDMLPRLQALLDSQESEPEIPGEMAEDSIPPAEPPIDEAPVAPGAALPPEDGNLPAIPPAAPAAPPAAAIEPPAGESPEKKKFAADTPSRLEDLSEEEIEKHLAGRRAKKYAAGESTAAGSVEGNAGSPAAGSVTGETDTGTDKAKYSALQGRIDKLEAERIERIEDARKARLNQLRYHRAFDLEKEVERCRYSKMDDAGFSSHCQVIADNYIPTMANAPMPVPDEISKGQPSPTVRAKPERYTREACETAIRICTELTQSGQKPVYETILDNIVNGRPANWQAE